MTIECKDRKLVEDDGVNVMFSKIDDQVVICTRKKLLAVCSECWLSEDCPDVKEFFTKLI